MAARSVLCLGCTLLVAGSAWAVPPDADYVMVPAGGFEMGQEGDAESCYDENPAHQVEINYEFAISTYEVTNAQYAAFLNSPAVALATPGILARLLDAGGLPLAEAYTDDAGDYRLDTGCYG